MTAGRLRWNGLKALKLIAHILLKMTCRKRRFMLGFLSSYRLDAKNRKEIQMISDKSRSD